MHICHVGSALTQALVMHTLQKKNQDLDQTVGMQRLTRAFAGQTYLLFKFYQMLPNNKHETPHTSTKNNNLSFI